MGRTKGSKNRPKENKQTEVKPKKVKQSVYSVSLCVNGQELKSEGETLFDVIRVMNPGTYKTKGILKITKDNKKVERILNIPQMKRLFGDSSSFTRQVAMESTAKYLENMLK